jgi:hypothetical protein
MGGRPQHVLTYVTLPTLAAPFFAALKTGGPLAILGVIGGEFIASSAGVGHELFTAANNLDAAAEFAALIILVTITLILNGALTLLDRIVLRRLGLDAARTPTARPEITRAGARPHLHRPGLGGTSRWRRLSPRVIRGSPSRKRRTPTCGAGQVRRAA